MSKRLFENRYELAEILTNAGFDFMVTGTNIEIRCNPDETKQYAEIIIRLEEVETP